MPEITIHGDFKVDPNYDAATGLIRSIEESRRYLDKRVASIDTIKDPTLQLICMFSLIDCLAQEWAGYPIRNFKGVFCDFVLAHQKTYDYLGKVEPVTLYYRIEDWIEKSPLLPGFPPEKEVSLESLGYIDSRLVKDVLPNGKADEILHYIAKKNGAVFAAQKAKEHRLIELIYRMRSKATHEMTGLGQETVLKKQYHFTEPYYRDVGRLYVLDDKVVSDNVCELVIPNSFIRIILDDCIDGYFSECREKCREPFSNDGITRKYLLSWYDK